MKINSTMRYCINTGVRSCYITQRSHQMTRLFIC